jgi:hypothetical protein
MGAPAGHKALAQFLIERSDVSAQRGFSHGHEVAQLSQFHGEGYE